MSRYWTQADSSWRWEKAALPFERDQATPDGIGNRTPPRFRSTPRRFKTAPSSFCAIGLTDYSQQPVELGKDWTVGETFHRGTHHGCISILDTQKQVGWIGFACQHQSSQGPPGRGAHMRLLMVLLPVRPRCGVIIEIDDDSA